MNKIYPFKFLDAYGKDDTHMFFGRDEEINAMYQMIFQGNMLLVYGASGTGKTSLIQCGLASKFQSHDWLALYIRRGEDLNLSFDKVIADTEGNYEEEEEIDFSDMMPDGADAVSTQKQTSPLAKSFRTIYLNYFRPVYLIFDQFEELFILGTKDEQRKFISTIQEILKLEQPVKMIFSVREEYLGHLYEFEKAVPQLMRKKLRVEPMNLGKVQEVIHGVTTFKGSNISIKEGEEEAITEKIFEKIKENEKTHTIQLPYLQVFLDKLYDESTGHDKTHQSDAVFTIDAINKMGNIATILDSFLEEQVTTISLKFSTKQKPLTNDDIWDILSPFVSIEGTKEPISLSNLLRKLPGVDPGTVKGVVDAFINCRILRYIADRNIYELMHDTLAKKIASTRSEEEVELLAIRKIIAQKKEEDDLLNEKQLSRIRACGNKLRDQLSEEEKELIAKSTLIIKRAFLKRRRNTRITIISLSAGLAVVLFLAIFSLKARSDAKQALKDLRITTALSKAKHWHGYAQSYKDNGDYDFALQSIDSALFELRNVNMLAEHPQQMIELHLIQLDKLIDELKNDSMYCESNQRKN